MERNDIVTAAAAPDRPLPGAYTDWAAILGGAVVAAAIAGVLTTFGAALGLATISAKPGEGSFDLWAIVTALWVVISLVVSYLAGGYVAGRMHRRVDAADAEEVATRDGINGLAVWSLGMLVTAWMAAGAIGGLASAVGTAAGAGAQAVGPAMGGAAQGAGAALGAAAEGGEGGVLDYLNATLMRPALGETAPGAGLTGAPAPDDAELARQTGAVLGNVLRSGEISDADRAFLIAATARRSGESEAAVEARVDEAVAAVQETRAEAARLAEEAEQAAIDAAETARISAILTAFLLTASALIAGAAAVSGAVRGGRHRDEGRIFGGLTYRI